MEGDEIIIEEERVNDETNGGFCLKLNADYNGSFYYSNMLYFPNEQQWNTDKDKIYKWFREDILKQNVVS